MSPFWVVAFLENCMHDVAAMSAIGVEGDSVRQPICQFSRPKREPACGTPALGRLGGGLFGGCPKKLAEPDKNAPAKKAVA
jgi:hypothetical protein